MSEYKNPDALVETDWLEEHLDDPAIRAIEVDEDTVASMLDIDQQEVAQILQQWNSGEISGARP